MSKSSRFELTKVETRWWKASFENAVSMTIVLEVMVEKSKPLLDNFTGLL